MEQKRAPLASRLFAHSLLDVKDEIEDRYCRYPVPCSNTQYRTPGFNNLDFFEKIKSLES
jgi:hypothetical protein